MSISGVPFFIASEIVSTLNSDELDDESLLLDDELPSDDTDDELLSNDSLLSEEEDDADDDNSAASVLIMASLDAGDHAAARSLQSAVLSPT